jgi:hypothetical protein
MDEKIVRGEDSGHPIIGNVSDEVNDIPQAEPPGQLFECGTLDPIAGDIEL